MIFEPFFSCISTHMRPGAQTITILVGGVSYLGHQNTKKCTINEMQMIGFEKTSRPFGFDDVLDQGLSRGLMLVKSASAEDWDLIVVNSVSARDKGHGNMNEE